MNRFFRRNCGRVVRIFWMLAFAVASSTSFAQTSSPTAAQAQSTTTLSISDRSRPLARAVYELGQKHGWLISYEDPAYEFPGDTEDATDRIYREKGVQVRPDSKRIIGPRHSNVSITYNSHAKPDRVLQQLVQEYAAKNGTEFEVRRLGNRYVVMPAKARDKSGKLVPQTPYLSTPISITEMERNGDEALLEICRVLTQLTGEKVFVGTGPHFFGSRLRLSAINEPARDVLARFLDSVGGDRVVWNLYRDPVGHAYGLNFGSAPRKTEAAPVAQQENRATGRGHN